MENWIVMGAVVFAVCLIHPPFLGGVLSVCVMMLATYIVFKLIGG